MADPVQSYGGSGVIQSTKDFKPTPAGLQRKWTLEINAGLNARKRWITEADKANKRYLGETATSDTSDIRARVNLYHANINIMLAILYGQVPKVDVSRRWQDPNDEEARAASEALERLLNTDIEDNADDFQTEVKDALLDWKVVGLGQARLRYTADFGIKKGKPAIMADDGTEKAPAVPDTEEKDEEDIETDYVHWRDFLWSPARRWKEVRWVAFRAEMTRDEAVKRFGKLGRDLPMQTRKASETGEPPEELKDAWSRIAVWEIWSKDEKMVYWYCEGYSQILDQKKDPLGLDGFFPCPRPLIANVTTSKFMPKPDLELDRHIYDEIDDIADRLRNLVKRCRITGAYDKGFPELGRILEEALEGQLVAVDGWGGLTEKGGVNGSFQMVDLKPIIEAIKVLTEKLVEKIQLLYQVTGLSDIVRGEASGKATATEQRLKAGFASTRLQTDQDEVARFATDLQKLRAEIISLHFDQKTIVERSNILRVELDDMKRPNIPLIQKAVELIKSDIWQYRIEVKSDAIALRDYAALKQERVETIGALAGMFQQAIPMVQMFPQAAPFVIEIGKWLIASTKGSQQLEGMFDRFAAKAEEAAANPQPPPPDPKLEAAKVKAQAEAGKAQASMQQTQVDGQVHMAKAAMDMHVAQQKHQLDVHKLAAQTEAEAQRAAIARSMPKAKT